MQILYNIYVSIGNLRVDKIPVSSFPSSEETGPGMLKFPGQK